MSARRRTSLTLFCLKFLVFAVAFTSAWWMLIPWYGYLLAQAAGGTLRYALGVPIEAIRVDPDGKLNTESLLVFVLDGRDRKMQIALLITNVAPYAALVLATGGLTWRRRLRILGIGCAILCAGHYLFIVLAFRLSNLLQYASELPTAIAQFFLTLPFLLWIVFAYWDQIGAYFSGPARSKKDAAPPE